MKRLGKTVTVMVPFMHMLNKTISAFAILYLMEYPYFSIMIFTQTTVLGLCVEIHYWPLKSWWAQVQVIVDQFAVLLVIYHLYHFTAFTPMEIK